MLFTDGHLLPFTCFEIEELIQFDLSLEETALRDRLEMQIQEVSLAEKRSHSSEMDII